jgi:HprK-related kinase B
VREALETVRRYPAVREIDVGLGDVAFTVRSNERDVAAHLERYFSRWDERRASARHFTVSALQGDAGIDTSEFVPVARSGGRAPKEAFRNVPGGRIVHKVRTGLVFFVETEEVTVVGDVLHNLNQVINLIANLYAQEYLDRGYVMVHASAASANRGVAFVAGSGGGKSTLALALLERGHRFVTNDRLLLRAWGDRPEMIGMPKLPRVNPGTLLRSPSLRRLVAEPSRYAHLDPGALWRLEEKHDVDVVEIYGRPVQPRGILSEVYVLSWSRGAGRMSVRPLTSIELGDRLWRELRTCGIFDLRAEPRLAWREEVMAVARKIRGFEVTGGVDVDALADRAAMLERA